MELTPTQQLVELKLGKPLGPYVRALRRNGYSWRRASLTIRDATAMDITPETLRSWYPEEKK